MCDEMNMRSHPSILLLLLLAGLCSACTNLQGHQPPRLVKVGILHSRTGTMSISENTVAEAELMAIDEINRAGGLHVNSQRLQIVPIEEDGMSDWPTFARKAARLIDRDQVSAVFGGWTSASRKQMLPIFESRHNLLFYPVQYEGQECSPAVVYGGSTPNQQSEPAINWLIKNRGTKFFLIGSDYVYPRTANQIVRAQVEESSASIVDEMYLPLGSKDVAPVIARIHAQLPRGGVVINTLNGDTNLVFFKALAKAGIDRSHGYTVMSFSVSEEEVSAIGPELMAGSMAVWSYFQSLPTPASRQFADHFRARYGLNRVVNDPAEAAYSLVYLWAAAVQRAGSVNPDKVRKALIGTTFEAPQGLVTVAENLHLNKRALIGAVKPNGQFQILQDAGVIAPQPFNTYIAKSKGHRCDWRGASAAAS
jgi:urea transport system substrate-binding protein